jgi:hypothetical protein
MQFRLAHIMVYRVIGKIGRKLGLFPNTHLARKNQRENSKVFPCRGCIYVQNNVWETRMNWSPCRYDLWKWSSSVGMPLPLVFRRCSISVYLLVYSLLVFCSRALRALVTCNRRLWSCRHLLAEAPTSTQVRFIPRNLGTCGDRTSTSLAVQRL